MATTRTGAPTVLTIRRSLAASRRRVFEAWTQPQAMSRWMAPSDEYEVNVPQADVRVGGRYRLEMRHPESGVHTAFGTYREVAPYDRLVFTWAWEGDDATGETLVTVQLADKGDVTELVLTHDLFPNAGARDEHAKGWAGCLDRLDRVMQG